MNTEARRHRDFILMLLLRQICKSSVTKKMRKGERTGSFI